MISGPTDLAELAVRVKFDDVDRASQSLDKLAQAGKRAESSTTGVGVSSVAATRSMGAWAAIQAEAAGRVGEHSLNLSRLESRLSAVVEKATGLNSALGYLGSSFLKFGVGDIYTIAIVGGLALVLGLYDKLTESSRKAREETDKLMESLEKAIHLKALGPGGSTVDEVTAANQRAADLKIQIAQLEKEIAGPDAGFGRRAMLQHNVDNLYVERQNALNIAAGGESIIKEKENAAIKEERDKAQREQKEAERKATERRLAREKEFGQEEAIRAEVANAHRDAIQAALGGPLKDLTTRGGHTDEPGLIHRQGYPDYIAAQQKRDEDRMKKEMDEAAKTRDAIWGAAISSANIIVSALNLGGGGRGSSIGGALGSSAGAAAGMYFGGPVGAEIGSTLGNIVGSLFGGLFDHAKAAREAAKAQRSITLELNTIAANLAHNQLASLLLGIEAQLQSTIASFNSALPGRRNERQRNADIAQAEALAEKQKQQAREDYARAQKYGNEDLTVRNLKALGRTDEANLDAFKEQQQRELTQAILDGRDQTYINNLLTTQNNELLAYQNGLLETAFRNAPTGFFVEKYLSDYVTPRGYPTDSGAPISGGGDTSNGGLTPPGGRSGGSRGRDLNIALYVDGRVLTTAVVKSIDQVGSSTGGSGTSRAEALNRYPT